MTFWKVVLRSITEYAAPLWHSGLCDVDCNKIEKLQKKVLGMILGTKYIENKRYYSVLGDAVPYKSALQHYGLTTLQQRREVLTQKFALETAKNQNHKDMFEFIQAKNITTRNYSVIQEKNCKTERYYKSSIPHMSRILNGVYITERKDKMTNSKSKL